MLRAQRTWKALVQPPGCWQAITAPSLSPQIAQRLSSLHGKHGGAEARQGSVMTKVQHWQSTQKHQQHCI
jgi:hypothetical protein